MDLDLAILHLHERKRWLPVVPPLSSLEYVGPSLRMLTALLAVFLAPALSVCVRVYACSCVCRLMYVCGVQRTTSGFRFKYTADLH